MAGLQLRSRNSEGLEGSSNAPSKDKSSNERNDEIGGSFTALLETVISRQLSSLESRMEALINKRLDELTGVVVNRLDELENLIRSQSGG